MSVSSPMWFSRFVPAILTAAILLSACQDTKAPPVTPEVEEKPVETPAPAPVTETTVPAPAAPTTPPATVEAPKAETPAPVVVEAPPAISPEQKPMKEGQVVAQGKDVITLGGGCFWCTEAVIERLEGVSDVVSGYMGGHVENPTYEQIGTKTTGHVEVIQVTFDPAKITLDELLDVFWQAHDPTTLNRQGADSGPQYASVIYYHSPEQRNVATGSMKKLDASGAYENPAVTKIAEAAKFWVAEDYHQNYYVLNKDKNPYCRAVISPKLKKLGME